ncbi:TetR/AcrR family transcriptional regulator [Labedella phragmitis]|uniref:TetR/AcrR family transcriptional regulator n=1 Tax=Labedella phragmitis TaxID=2498849 RepID=UPI001FB84CE4|nr:TetR/AcrR family transcriptional regulator [Labedella phragmitis]
MTDDIRSRSAGSAQKRRPRGSYAKSVDTQEAILDAALGVFAQNGFRSGSLREIAQRVGISEAGLLHHFESKARLLAAVLDRRDELARAIVPSTSEDGVKTLRGLIALARFNASEPAVVELFCTLSAEATSATHPAHAYFIRRYETVRATVFAAFSDLEGRGLLRSGVTPDGASRATIAIMDGLQIQWLLDRGLMDMAEDLHTFLGTLTSADL